MIRLSRFILLASLVNYLAACSVASEVRPDAYYENTNYSGDQTEDLFSSQGDMSNQEIEKILDYQLRLPAANRIAILHLSHNPYWRFYSHDFAQLNDEIAKNFIDTLKESERVYDVSYLPALLVPENRTLPFLRAAAARYQADLLLLYRDQCGSFEKYRAFKPDETRAYCAVEAVLVDIRSGIIPFTVVANESFSAKKIKQDMNFTETVKKAEFKALSKALGRLATDLNNFLNQIS